MARQELPEEEEKKQERPFQMCDQSIRQLFPLLIIPYPTLCFDVLNYVFVLFSSKKDFYEQPAASSLQEIFL
jgi:hypothetical protein